MKIYEQSYFAAKMLLSISAGPGAKLNFEALKTQLGTSKTCIQRIITMMKEANLVKSLSDDIFYLKRSSRDISFQDINVLFENIKNQRCS